MNESKYIQFNPKFTWYQSKINVHFLRRPSGTTQTRPGNSPGNSPSDLFLTRLIIATPTTQSPQHSNLNNTDDLRTVLIAPRSPNGSRLHRLWQSSLPDYNHPGPTIYAPATRYAPALFERLPIAPAPVIFPARLQPSPARRGRSPNPVLAFDAADPLLANAASTPTLPRMHPNLHH